MSAFPPTPNSNVPVKAETACGASINVTPNTPYIHYRGEIVYFCGGDCKQLYDEDPSSSCMAARLLSGD
jgi:YHS domain-containing protein